MSWRLARSLHTLRQQVNEAAPARNRASDGTIGDANHKSRNSDHNPWVEPPHGGVVTALDLTHDPANNADMVLLAEHLRQTRDPRIKYVIFAGRMFSSYSTSSTPAWTWRNYTGRNQHHTHLHISVNPQRTHYDNETPWAAVQALTPTPRSWSQMASRAEVKAACREALIEVTTSLGLTSADGKPRRKDLARDIQVLRLDTRYDAQQKGYPLAHPDHVPERIES